VTVKLAVLLTAPSVGLAASGCSAATPAGPQASARSTVSSYSAAVTAHHWTEATALLSPSVRRTQSTAAGNDRSNTVSVTNVHLTVYPAPSARGDHPGPTDVQQALVTYGATCGRV